jgi:hypothetical protein
MSYQAVKLNRSAAAEPLGPRQLIRPALCQSPATASPRRSAAVPFVLSLGIGFSKATGATEGFGASPRNRLRRGLNDWLQQQRTPATCASALACPIRPSTRTLPGKGRGPCLLSSLSAPGILTAASVAPIIAVLSTNLIKKPAKARRAAATRAGRSTAERSHRPPATQACSSRRCAPALAQYRSAWALDVPLTHPPSPLPQALVRRMSTLSRTRSGRRAKNK